MNVHEARKRLKELRAVLRFAASGTGAKWLSRLFRDTGRQLAAARETDSALETFRGLRLRRQLDPADFERIHECLAGESKPIDMRALCAPLAAARERISAWPADDAPLRPFQRRLRRTYRSARRRMHRAVRSQSAADFHRWRTRAKEEWYQTLLLATTVPELREREARLHALAHMLGKHHDLMGLRDALERHADAIGPAASEKVIATVLRRSANLEKKAFAVGATLFSEPARRWIVDPSPVLTA